MVPIFLQKPERIGVAEILELYQSVLAVTLDNGFHELFEKLVVLLSGDAFVSVADVERVIQKGLKNKQTKKRQ